MDVNRSGYYKWKARKGHKNRYEQNRELLTELLRKVHDRHRSYGYHRLAAVVRNETGWLFSDNLAHKCCKFAGIKSRVKHYRWQSPKGESKVFPNLVWNHWEVGEPLRLISSHISFRQGDNKPYFRCLNDLIEKTKEQENPVILHTDQGSVYSSAAFYDAHRNYNILRSMSRVATPTDNPKIEAINGWIKAEMYSEGWHRRYDTAEDMVKAFVDYYNNERPAYALNYKSPLQFKTEMGFV